MGLKKLFIIPILISFVLLPATPVLADEVTASDIASKLICQCGCGRILDSHVCATQESMVALIEQKLAQGQSEAEIIQFFVDQYGEQVLAEPTKRGFNLTVWVLPFAVLLLGGGIVYSAIRVWTKRGKMDQTKAIAEAEEGDEEYRHRLEKELEEFDERGFR